MSKSKKHNLSFSEEELTGKKAEKLSADISKAKHNVKPKNEMKVKQNLKFEENKPKPSSKFKSEVKSELKDVPRKTVSAQIHNKIAEDSDENSSVDAADKGSRLVDDSVHRVKTHQRRQNRNVTDESTRQTREERQKLRQEKREMNDEKSADKDAIKTKYNEYIESNPNAKSNPYSRWRQKQDIKKEYYAAKHGGSSATSATASEIGDKAKAKAKDAAENIGTKIADFAKDNKAAIIIVGGIILALVIGMSLLGSTGGVLASSGSGAVGATSYPSEDEEMLNAEAYYKNLESQLATTIATYESTHSYHEYHYDIDTITHDPYELTSLLTAYSEGEYIANEVQSFEMAVYASQYSLTQRVVTQTRYRNETRYRRVIYYNDDGTTTTYIERYTVSVPYDYYICYVTLKNNGMDRAASTLLTTDQQDMYEIYNLTKGNREDLF